MPGLTISRRGLIGLLLMLLALGLLWRFDAQIHLALKLGGDTGRFMALAGYWLGHGLTLISVSVLAYFSGRLLGRPQLKSAGKQTLAAFALSGLLAQLLKRLIGRPRPRLWAEGITHFGPTLADGLDSFPSGHTATTVAAALVLSWHYPGLGALFMAWAAFVAAARLIGGAHFPLDVLAGVILGLAAGWGVIVFFHRQRPSKAGTEAGR